VWHWDEPIAGLSTRAGDLERVVLRATEHLAYPGTRQLEELAAIAHLQRAQHADLLATTDELVAALWQALRSDPLASGEAVGN
jgi:hypothetical protein